MKESRENNSLADKIATKTDFLLKGLSAPKSFTCYTMDGKTIFWAKTNMTDDRYKALFNWAKTTDDFWKSKWIAEIEHNGLYEDGTPINPIVCAIREQSNPQDSPSSPTSDTIEK